MRFVDFLIHLLQTQAETLRRLAAFFGEEELLQLLEAAGDNPNAEEILFSLDRDWFDEPAIHLSAAKSYEGKSCYAELEGAVQDFNLPSVLEFHLWAYPYYRSLIEGPIDLKSRIRGPAFQAIDVLVGDALSHAKAWIKLLPISPEISMQAERAALVPWLKFRSEVLKRSGKRPIASI